MPLPARHISSSGARHGPRGSRQSPESCPSHLEIILELFVADTGNLAICPQPVSPAQCARPQGDQGWGSGRGRCHGCAKPLVNPGDPAARPLAPRHRARGASRTGRGSSQAPAESTRGPVTVTAQRLTGLRAAPGEQRPGVCGLVGEPGHLVRQRPRKSWRAVRGPDPRGARPPRWPRLPCPLRGHRAALLHPSTHIRVFHEADTTIFILWQ